MPGKSAVSAISNSPRSNIISHCVAVSPLHHFDGIEILAGQAWEKSGLRSNRILTPRRHCVST